MGARLHRGAGVRPSRGKLLLFYAGAYNNEPQQIGYAISDDGITWTRETTEPFLPRGEPGSWNSSESGHPGVLTDDDGRTFLFFQGNDSGGQTNLLTVTEINWEGDRPVLRRNPTPDRTPSSLQRPCSRG